MSDEYLFISDCHLHASRQDILHNLTVFLQTRAIHAGFLYILGDFFDTWVGDDDPAEDYAEIFHCLNRLSQHTRITFLVGNRDFLFSHAGAHRMGAEIQCEPILLTLGQQRTALLHGDALCTDDHDYQSFKKTVRGEAWQADFLNKPLLERKHIASELRKSSQDSVAHKSMAVTDASGQTVSSTFSELGVDTIIHGHTHRPAVHHYEQGKMRCVLGDWNPEASYLSWTSQHGFVLNDQRVAL